VTPDSSWWDRAKQPPRPQPIEIRKQERLCTLRKGEHMIELEKRAVFGVGEEMIPSVNSIGGGCGCSLQTRPPPGESRSYPDDRRENRQNRCSGY
jgi:hypothetical protein